MRSYHLNLMCIMPSSNFSRMFLSISSILTQIIMNVQIFSLMNGSLIRSVTLFLFSSLPWLFTDCICSWRWNTPLVFSSCVNTNCCSNVTLSSLRGRNRLIKVGPICSLILFILLFLSSCSLLPRGYFINNWFCL